VKRGVYVIVMMGVLWAASVCMAEDIPAAREAAEKEEMVPEHGKLNTADATPVDPGHIELEFGYSYIRAKRQWDSKGKSRSRGLCEEHATGLSLTVGALEDLDFNIGMDYLWLHDKDNAGATRGDAIGDLSLGGRYRFFKNESLHLEAAYISGFTIPTGTRSNSSRLGTSQEFWSWDNTLAFTKDWGRWTTNADLGYSLPFGERRGDARGVLGANVAVGYQLLDWLQPEVELNYAREFIKRAGDAQDLAVTAGLVMPINERWRVNLGVQQSVWGKNTDKATAFVLGVKLAF